MASLKYLWSNRVVFSFYDKRFYLAWAKRILTLNELNRRNKNRVQLCKRGAVIHQTAEIGKVKIDGKQKNLLIDANTFIGQASIALHDKITIGKNVCINDGVVLLTASHDLNDPEWKHKKAPITIEDFVWIATDAMILPGVKIGKGAVVGARAVVSKNVEPYQIVTGNPAQPLAKTRTPNLDYNPCEFLAANSAWLKG